MAEREQVEVAEQQLVEVPAGAELEWMPLADAAAHLGLSKDQVRRRIHNGQLPHLVIDRPQGIAYVVGIQRGLITQKPPQAEPRSSAAAERDLLAQRLSKVEAELAEVRKDLSRAERDLAKSETDREAWRRMADNLASREDHTRELVMQILASYGLTSAGTATLISQQAPAPAPMAEAERAWYEPPQPADEPQPSPPAAPVRPPAPVEVAEQVAAAPAPEQKRRWWQR